MVGFEIDTEGPGRNSGVPITSEDEEEFRRLAANPDVYDLISKSIAPSIYGSIGEFVQTWKLSYAIGKIILKQSIVTLAKLNQDIHSTANLYKS